MGFFGSSGSKLTAPATSTADTIPTVTDTVEEDVSASYAQQHARKRGLRSTLTNDEARSPLHQLNPPVGNSTLG